MDPRIEEAQELVMSLKSKSQARKEKLLRKEKKRASNNNNNNNNNEDFKSNYATSDHDHSPNGRLSRNSGSGSNESAFSSSSAASSSEGEDSEDNQTNCEHQSMSSGRSSADQSVVSSSSSTSDRQLAASSGDKSNVHEPPKQLNTVCNLVPVENPIARDLVEQVRCKLLDSLRHPESQSLVDKYEQVDLVELKKGFLECEDLDESGGRREEQSLAFRLISRFINFKELIELETKRRNNKLQNTNDHDDQKALVDKALDDATSKLKELLLFRRQYRLSQALDDQFCKEMHMLHGIFPFGHDKNHLPVLYLRARIHRRWSRELDDMFRRYVAWQVNLLTKSYQGAQVNATIGRNAIEKDGSFGICFDCLSVSYSCVDMDFLSYLVKILVNYYPTYCRYALCVDLPWLFRSVWKMVRSWLPEDARNTVHLITSKQLVEFIDEDQIPNSIRINELPAHEKPDSLKHKLPENFDSIRSIEQIAKDLNVSSSEVKQFKAHVDKVRKEYQQLGAI